MLTLILAVRMRLGAQKSELVEGTKTREVYGSADIIERHRHRYEMNNRFIPALEEAGMKIFGLFTCTALSRNS